jgi:hypothetical protein
VRADRVCRGAGDFAEGRGPPPLARRRTARALYAEAKAAGYDGGYTRVTDFIRPWRQGQGQSVERECIGAVALRPGRGVPVRPARGRADGGRHLLLHAGLAHEAVRFAGILSGGLPQPGPRDDVRRPQPVVCGAGRCPSPGDRRLAC